MFNIFLLAKITNYADSLMNGEIYMNSLGYFREIEAKENKNEKIGTQIDFSEGRLGLIHQTPDEIIEFMKKHTSFTNEAEADNWYNMLREGMTDDQAISIDSFNYSEKIFCMYTFYFNSVEHTYLAPNEKLRDFGKDVVFIYQPIEFLNRFFEAAAKVGIGFQQKIRYCDFYDFSFDYYWGNGYKDSRFSWQNEYRLICHENNPAKVLKLNIGNMSDIAFKMSIDDFLIPDKFAEKFSDIRNFKPIIKDICSAEQDIPI